MISNYKQITGRYLKANKKRTTLTIIGIVLSVALIATIGLFFKGMQEAQLDKAKNDYGTYDVMYKDLNDQVYNQVINNPKVGNYGYFIKGEEVKLSNDMVAERYIATNKALELLPFTVKEGKIPEKQDEFAMEQWGIKYLKPDLKIGEKVKLNDKEYTFVGILNDSLNTVKDNEPRIIMKDNNLDKAGATLLVQVSSKANLKKAVAELKQIGDEDNVSTNEPVLMLEGAGESSGSSGLVGALSIIIAIVVVATIAVIYNSFQISVVERIKEFGLLRAVGTTPKQIRKIVLKEATILASIGVPIGILCGIIAVILINFLFKLIGGDSVLQSKVVINPMIIGLSMVLGVISVYLSALLPARYAGKISPLVAISSRASITKGKIKKSENRIIKKLFGFEGALAAKNIKRNKKRYRITVFSIVISVVLFVTFKTFMYMTLTITEDPNESRNIHFLIYNNGGQKEKDKVDMNEVASKVKSLGSVSKVFKNYAYYEQQAVIDSGKELKEVDRIGGVYKRINYQGKEQTLVNSSIAVYDQAALEVAKKYLVQGTIDADKINKENGVILIKKNNMYNDATKKKYSGAAADIKVGDIIPTQFTDYDKGEVEFGKGEVKNVKVVAIVSSDPFDFYGDQNGLKFISTENVIKGLSEKNQVTLDELAIEVKDPKNDKVAQADIEKAIQSTPELNVINRIDSNRTEKSNILMVQILIYGFIIVISLISSVNIINTITTNIILRKREFAALKSIGLTQKGLKKMIVLEGILYSVIGTIYGSIIGTLLSYLLYKQIAQARSLSWRLPYDAIIIALVASLIIGYLAVLSPLSRIKKTNLVEAIREE